MNLETLDIPNELPAEALNAPVTGAGLSPGTLGDQLSDGLTLLVFLRHFGCMFCRETLTDMRAASEADRGFPKALFFFQGSPMEGKALLQRYWPGLRAVADPSAEFYDGFGIKRGGWVETLGPGVWAARSRPTPRSRSAAYRRRPRFHRFHIKQRRRRRIHDSRSLNTEGVWQKPKYPNHPVR